MNIFQNALARSRSIDVEVKFKPRKFSEKIKEQLMKVSA